MGSNMGNQNSSTSPRADPATIKSIDDCIFSFYGNFGQGKSHVELRRVIEEAGGGFEDYESRVENCTHLITTEKYVTKPIMPVKIKDAALKGCAIVGLGWLLTSLSCRCPVDTKKYRLETTKLAQLRLKASEKASPRPEAKEKPKLNVKKVESSKPRLKNPDERQLKLKDANERNVLAKSQPKENDEAKPKSKGIEKPKPKYKGIGESKRALECFEDGDGTKKVAKTSSKVIHLKGIVDENFLNLAAGLAVCVEGNVVWDATLMRPLTQRTEKLIRHFAILRTQLLWDPSAKKYDTFSYERTGDAIPYTSRSGLGTMEEAKAAFKESFQEATGLSWEDRLKDPKKRKFIYVEHRLEDEEASKSAMPIAKMLPPMKAVLDIILPGKGQTELIKTFLKATPASHVKNGSALMTLHQLRAGIALIKRVLERPDLANEIFSNASPASIMLQCYYCLIGDGLSRAPLSLDWIQREQDRLSYLHILAMASQPNRPLGRAEEELSQHLHRLLGLNHMALVNSSTEEYRILANYFNFSDMASTYHGGYDAYTNQLKNIFRIERLGEADRFLRWTTAGTNHGRCLLWHGSDNSSFRGIFEQGLRGGIGERKIFLSGLAGYSTAYCNKRTGMVFDTPKLMLLCEVSSPKFSEKRMGGDWWRDAGCVHADLQGAKMLNVPLGERYRGGAGWPIQKEYSFDKAEQIRMRYLFEFDISPRR
ncbi:poly-ribose polymerase [Penicillium longicatenatum]|nr:poly-ribose polymerase [Penicillium longicatenatum]